MACGLLGEQMKLDNTKSHANSTRFRKSSSIIVCKVVALKHVHLNLMALKLNSFKIFMMFSFETLDIRERKQRRER